MTKTLSEYAGKYNVRTDTRTDTSDSDAKRGWFSSIIRQLIGKNAGLALSVITGEEERTCYRYAAGTSNPSNTTKSTAVRRLVPTLIPPGR